MIVNYPRCQMIMLGIQKCLGDPVTIGKSKRESDRSVSQSDIAKKIGVSRRTINATLLGSEGIGVGVALKIEQAFGIPAEATVIAAALDQLDKERNRHD